MGKPPKSRARRPRIAAFAGMAMWLAALLPAPAAANPMWHADGTRVVDGAGTPVRITGFNIGNWLMWEGWMFGGTLVNGETAMLARIASLLGSDAARGFHRDVQDAYVREDDVATIARGGFTTIRLPINYRSLVTDRGCLACDGQGWRHIDRLLGWARAHRLHVILDMHGAPGGQAGLMTADSSEGRETLWKRPADRARLATIWTALARRYAANETVAGYDLVNEPIAPDGAALMALYRELIAAIRTVDRDHMIWLEGNRMSADLAIFAAPLPANTGISIHVYTFPFDDRQARIDLAARTAERLGVPAWIGEFGLAGHDRDGETMRMVDAAPTIAGWSYWTWKRASDMNPGPAPSTCRRGGSRSRPG